MVGQFLKIQQETMVVEYYERFKKMMAPVLHLSEEVLLETFVTVLDEVIK